MRPIAAVSVILHWISLSQQGRTDWRILEQIQLFSEIMHVSCWKVKSLSMAMWVFPIHHYSTHCGKEAELSDESRSVDDEILTLIHPA